MNKYEFYNAWYFKKINQYFIIYEYTFYYKVQKRGLE